MKQDFKRQIYDDVKKLFPDGGIEVLVAKASFSDGMAPPVDSAIRLVHKPSGLQATCGDFPSQIENYIAAAIRLRIACDERNS
jgi:protein subunit release factor A